MAAGMTPPPRRALVTGGASPLGQAICRRLVADGLHVAVHAHANLAGAQALAAELSTGGGSAEALACDLADFGATAAALAPLLDAVLSVEDVGVFKPDPRVYPLMTRRFGLEPAQIAFVSSNAWDAQAAAAFGARVFWCNRKAQPDEYGLGGMATVIPGLAALPGLLQ